MSNALFLNLSSALLLSCLLIAFHCISFSIFVPGLCFFNDLLSYESRIIFFSELRRNYWLILMYLIPIFVNLTFTFYIIAVRIKLHSMTNIASVFFIASFPWMAYHCVALTAFLLATKELGRKSISQFVLAKDIIFTFSNSALSIAGGILAYSLNSSLFK